MPPKVIAATGDAKFDEETKNFGLNAVEWVELFPQEF
jgi:hypothetical protein